VAHVSITELLENTAGNHSGANTTMASWDTQTAAVDGTNLRDEGVERRNIADNVATRAAQVFVDGADTDTISSTSYVAVNLTATDAKISFSIGDLVATDTLVLRCSAQVRPATGGSTNAQLALQVNVAGAGWTTIDWTQRTCEWQDHASADEVGGWHSYNVSTVVDFDSISGVSAPTILQNCKFQLVALVDANSVQVENVVLTCRPYRFAE